MDSKIKRCVICGDTFAPRPYNRSVCYKDHYHPCPICGKDVLCNDPNRQFCACSRKCGSQMANESRKQSNLLKYGVENVSQVASVKESISKKLSSIHPKQPKQYKTCEVCGKPFELNWPYTQHTCSPQCRGKYRKNSGVASEVYRKACQTNLDRYGVENQGTRPEIHIKMEDTMEARYGVRYARYLPEIEEKVRQTNLARYGVPYYIATEQANQSNNARTSKVNQTFYAFLQANNIEYEIEKYVGGKFYDAYIPSTNCLIEINPTYSHTTAGNHWNSAGISSDYHLEKLRLAEANGYRCVHVWEWDNWEDILDILSPKSKIYARQCVVRCISKHDADAFTQKNHLSGKCNGQIVCYGLYYKADIVAVMTFGHPRYNTKYDYEMLRMCSKKGVQVIGGASKLFHAFITAHPTNSVISYCDISKFSGAVYYKIGMSLVTSTAPNKIWSKGRRKITNNLLMSRGYDQLFNAHYGKGTNNEQLMLNNGWLPVYDCGQLVFQYLPADLAQ